MNASNPGAGVLRLASLQPEGLRDGRVAGGKGDEIDKAYRADSALQRAGAARRGSSLLMTQDTQNLGNFPILNFQNNKGNS